MSMKLLATLPSSCCAPGAPPLSEEQQHDLAARFKALGDPARVAIVNRLAGAGEVCVCAFVDDLGLSQPTVSHHLKVLREAGLVESRRHGTWSHYRLVPETVAALAGSLAGR
jgi:DNA-binding transcriptional ArsR family regulator